MHGKKVAKILGVASILLATTWSAQALNWIGLGYAVLNVNGAGTTFYDIDNPTANPDFVGTTFTITAGQSILLGGEVQTNDGNGSNNPWGADNAQINYSITAGGPSGSVGLPFSFLPFSFNSGFNDGWQNTVGSEIGSGLAAGTYNLAVWFSATDNDGPNTVFLSNGGNNYNATIVVNGAPPGPGSGVPEPGMLSLAAVAGMILMSARRRLKSAIQA
ncbi:MAG: hypothetical protein H7A43_10225 [Verrucomicrobia bacterium]|nr:hypothetical protein [Verrucomicrobiota bacterium]